MFDYTDTQLKQALAKMLPELLCIQEHRAPEGVALRFTLHWKGTSKGFFGKDREVLDIELLGLCWDVEEDLRKQGFGPNYNELWEVYLDLLCVDLNYYAHATWRQRIIRLARVKGIEIV
jgi:hypothetical protein